MINYRIWECENADGTIIVELFNNCDILSVQKEFISKGYIVKEVIIGFHGKYMMRLEDTEAYVDLGIEE